MQPNPKEIKLIVGLGNSGPKYQNTRHNVGFLFLDYLIKQYAAEEMLFKQDKNFELLKYSQHKLWLLKPLTMMNLSGLAVAEVLKNSNHTKDNIILVHDDLDIQLGKYKFQLAKSPKQHNGVISVEQVLGTKDFNRVRIGVENRNVTEDIGQTTPTIKPSGMDYVLSDFSAEENQLLDKVFAQIAAEII